jgi:hypothetical protein
MVYALGFSLEKVAAMQEHGINGWLNISSSSWNRCVDILDITSLF